MRITVAFPQPNGGFFSHFAHFVCDFVLPFFSVLRGHGLIDRLQYGGDLTLEIGDAVSLQFGPMLPLVQVIFPSLRIEHVCRFTTAPIVPMSKGWHNTPDDVDHFADYLRRTLPLTPSPYGVVIAVRGLDRDKYPGDSKLTRSGADRRAIGSGLERLVEAVTEIRPDTFCAVLEHLTFAEQVSLFMAADTLIAQHGAALAHGHWMPRGGQLIELQCWNTRLCEDFAPAVARIRGHRWSPIYYPCISKNWVLNMRIDEATQISSLLRPRCGPRHLQVGRPSSDPGE